MAAESGRVSDGWCTCPRTGVPSLGPLARIITGLREALISTPPPPWTLSDVLPERLPTWFVLLRPCTRLEPAALFAAEGCRSPG